MLAELSIGYNEKKHQRSNAIVQRGPLLRLVVPKRYPSTLGNFYVFSYHIGQTCPIEECSGSRKGFVFFGRSQKKRRPRRTSLWDMRRISQQRLLRPSVRSLLSFVHLGSRPSSLTTYVYACLLSHRDRHFGCVLVAVRETQTVSVVCCTAAPPSNTHQSVVTLMNTSVRHELHPLGDAK